MEDTNIQFPPYLKSRIEQVLSEILSDKYDADITMKFVPREQYERDRQKKEETA